MNFFDDFTGGGIDPLKWTVTNGTGFSVANGFLKGQDTSGRLTSKDNFSLGTVLEIKAQTDTIAPNGQMIGGFYLAANNNIGWLNHPGAAFYRNNSSWVQGYYGETPANNMLYTITAKDAATVSLQMYKLDTSAMFWDTGDISHTLGNKPIVLGTRFDDILQGQTYRTSWDWVRVRKYAATPPAATAGTPVSNPWTTDFDMQFDYNVLSGLMPGRRVSVLPGDPKRSALVPTSVRASQRTSDPG